MNEMNITTTYGEISNAVPALNALVKEPIAASAALQLARCIRCINDELTTFAERKTEVAMRHGAEESPGKPGMLEVPPENLDAFYADIDEMLETAVSLPFPPKPVNLLDGATMSTIQMQSLMFLFE